MLGIGKAGAIHSLIVTDCTLAGPLQVSLCKNSVHQPGPSQIPNEVQHVCVGKPTSGAIPTQRPCLGGLCYAERGPGEGGCTTAWIGASGKLTVPSSLVSGDHTFM